MLIAALAAAFVFGACAGSFLGVVIYRMPRSLSIVRPPSRCGACGTQLAAYDNIPILGWLLLRGRCRHCGTAIPASCLYMELAVAVISTLVVWAVETQPILSSKWIYATLIANPELALHLPKLAAIAVLLLVLWLIIAEVLIDWKHLMIPDELTKGLQAVAIPLATLVGTNRLWPGNTHAESTSWMDTRTWFSYEDVMNGMISTPQYAAWALGISTVIGLTLIAITLLPARRIYGTLKESWTDLDHRAMAMGAWWYIGCTAFWTAIAVLVILNQPTSGFSNDWGRSLPGYALSQAILGSLLGWWLPWTVGLLGTMVFKRNAMGYGDVKMFCGLGAFLGPAGTVIAFMLATLVGTLVGIPARLMGGGREMPFGPSLAIGAVLTVALGPWLAPMVLGRLLG